MSTTSTTCDPNMVHTVMLMYVQILGNIATVIK